MHYVLLRIKVNLSLVCEHKVAADREPESLVEPTKNPRWVEAMNEEMQALSKNET